MKKGVIIGLVVLVAIIIIFAVYFQLTGRVILTSEQINYSVSDTIINFSEANLPSAPGDTPNYYKNDLAEFGDSLVYVYLASKVNVGNVYYALYINKTSGEMKHILLPGFKPYFSNAHIKYELISENELILVTSVLDGQEARTPTGSINFTATNISITAYDYILNFNSGTATLKSNISALKGNGNTREKKMIRLKSGGLVVSGYNHVWTCEMYLDYWFAYRNPSGIWSTQIVSVNASIPLAGWSLQNNHELVQHPADDSIWFFGLRDSFGEIQAIHFTETPSGLRYDWQNWQFIVEYHKDVCIYQLHNFSGSCGIKLQPHYCNFTIQDKGNAPNGEMPYLVASADSIRKTIFLAYQNENFTIYQAIPMGNGAYYFWKGAHISVAEIYANATKSFINLSVDIERISSFSMMTSNNKVWLVENPLNSTRGVFDGCTFDNLYIYSYDFSSKSWDWGINLEKVSRNETSCNSTSSKILPIICSSKSLTCIVKMQDYKFHMFKIIPTGQNPPPTIICNSDSDCGINNWISNPSCLNNDIYQDYRNYTCLNPGTSNSNCTYTDILTLKQNCGDNSTGSFGSNYCKLGNVYHNRTNIVRGCSLGSCTNNNVFDEQLIQTCANGCTNGVCNLDVIKCTSNANCGANSWTGSPICLNNNVYQNYITFTCNNPGTTSSSCINSTTSTLKQTCTYGCTNGVCNSNQDITPPIVKINSPVANSVISGTKSISTSASDSGGIKTINIYTDTTKVKTCLGVTTCSYTWNTRKVTKGLHTIRVDAIDNSGNTGTSSIQVTVK